MKKTLNINLAGYPFIIDEDAYHLLKDYLDTIRYAFATDDDTEDLAADIENRIAELLIDKEEGGIRIVSKEEIAKVIERIGKPSEFIEVSEDTSSDKDENQTRNEETFEESRDNTTPPPYQSEKASRNPFVRKRIFRDPQAAMLGGVCAGLAAYLHIDVTVIRLITVLLFFLSASTVAIVYIILWIVVPEARSPLQRMQMLGEDTTVENIGKTVTGNYQDNNSEMAAQPKTGLVGFLSSALSIFIKILIFLGLLIAIPLLIALSAGLIGCIIAAFIIGISIAAGITDGTYGWFDSTLEGQFVFYILLAVIGGIITVGIPVWLFFRMLWQKKDNSKNHYPSKTRPTLLAIWLGGLALLAVFTVKAVKKDHQISVQEWGGNVKALKELEKIEAEDIENISIKRGGVIIETSNEKIEIANGRVNIDKTDISKDTLEISVPTDSMSFMESSYIDLSKVADSDSIK